MIEGIEIKLTAPICTCKVQNLGWGINPNNLTIFVTCKSCGTELVSPYAKVKAAITLDIPYPETKHGKTNLFLVDFKKEKKD